MGKKAHALIRRQHYTWGPPEDDWSYFVCRCGKRYEHPAGGWATTTLARRLHRRHLDALSLVPRSTTEGKG